MRRLPVTLHNRVTKRYLRLWLYLDNNIDHLSDKEMVQAKILYACLRRLNEDEVNIIAAKYRTERVPYIPDAEVAAGLDMEIKDYQKNRVAIEHKLRFLFKNYIEDYQDELISSTRKEESNRKSRGK